MGIGMVAYVLLTAEAVGAMKSTKLVLHRNTGVVPITIPVLRTLSTCQFRCYSILSTPILVLPNLSTRNSSVTGNRRLNYIGEIPVLLENPVFDVIMAKRFR